MNSIISDIDPQGTREWVEALQSVLKREGRERARFLIECLMGEARRSDTHLTFEATTPYINTIPPEREKRSPGLKHS